MGGDTRLRQEVNRGECAGARRCDAASDSTDPPPRRLRRKEEPHCGRRGGQLLIDSAGRRSCSDEDRTAVPARNNRGVL